MYELKWRFENKLDIKEASLVSARYPEAVELFRRKSLSDALPKEKGNLTMTDFENNPPRDAFKAKQTLASPLTENFQIKTDSFASKSETDANQDWSMEDANKENGSNEQMDVDVSNNSNKETLNQPNQDLNRTEINGMHVI